MEENKYLEEIEKIEISNKIAIEVVRKGEALQRLLENPDYKLIIREGFFKEYPEKLGVAIATNTGAYDESKLFEHLKGINTLIGFEKQIALNHEVATQELIDNEELLANITLDSED